MRFTKFLLIGLIACIVYILHSCATQLPGREERMEFIYGPSFQKIIDYEIQKLERGEGNEYRKTKIKEAMDHSDNSTTDNSE